MGDYVIESDPAHRGKKKKRKKRLLLGLDLKALIRNADKLNWLETLSAVVRETLKFFFKTKIK